MTQRRLTAAVLAFAALTGCQSTPSAPTSVARRSAENRQHLFTATISDPKTFNPIIATDEPSTVAVGQLFDTLVRLNPRTEAVEPALAKRWECDAAGTTCDFFLRRDVRWHDGQPLTAEDAVFTFDAIYHDRVPNSLKHVLTIDGERIHVEALDTHTIRLRLPRRFAPLLNSIAVPIVPKHILGESLATGSFTQQWGIDTPPEQLIGSGPYRMVKYIPAQYIQLARNPDYWMRDAAGTALPQLAKRTIRIVPNQDTVYLKFLAGEIDIHSPRPEEVPDLQQRQETLGISVQEIGLDTGTLFLTFNRNPAHYVKNGKRDPRLDWFTDKQFLRAIAHSIDKVSFINDTMYGFGRPAATYISPENRQFHNPQLEDYPYDLDRARRILAEAGYADRDGDGIIEDPNGNPIAFTLYTNAGNRVREKMCSILLEDLTALGMKVNYRPLDFTLLVEKLDTTFDWDAMLIGFTGAIEPHNAANLLRSRGNLHFWHPNQSSPASEWEAEIDRLLEAGSRELDPEARRQSYWRIQELLHEELPMIPTIYGTRFTAHTEVLENFYPTVWGVYRPEQIRFTDQ